ncbi:MAG: DUF47 domain-containing protein [Oceanidesulfovibrio sp.]
MSLRIPFFGLVSPRSPLKSLLEHYDTIARGCDPIEESLVCYIAGGGVCREFKELSMEVDELEDKADKIKRSIRNHLPRGLFMPVDKTVFFNYTRMQDNILDDGQRAMNWLLMRRVTITEDFQKGLLDLVAEAVLTVKLLRPALEATVGLLHGEHYDRDSTKDKIREVRAQHKKTGHAKNSVVIGIYNSDMDFKDIYQLIHFAEAMHSMSHNTEGSADLLRAMIAR